MIGALWTGISGLSSQQQALDNESNNIANVNTIGFKASRISFADQMYQDRIGKGSKILDAEKLYTQGNLKLTGVNYDMALSGDGFFTVVNTRTAGASETLYTRAGNFRMGDNGTLQDAAGNEVQGWPMIAIDSQNDVTSTNPNVNVFNTDYTKLISSKVIRYNNYVETVTAKATDYSSTAKSDSTSVFSGDGAKTKSSKISDVEAAIKDYTSWLQKLKDEPDASSSTSIAQISQINFKTGSESVVGQDGHQIYVYVDGNKISQNYIPTVASEDFKTSLLQGTNTGNLGLVNSGTSLTFTPTAVNNTRYTIDLGGTEIYYDSTLMQQQQNFEGSEVLSQMQDIQHDFNMNIG
ncbi:MAG: flagellar hook basal-body protein [Arcobacter sp.]|nr:flagellar hook basal-body protein [Arcobacter sp.]